MDDKKKFLIKDDHNLSDTGPYKIYKDSKIEDTATNVYYKTERKKPDSQVSIPTVDAVLKAKNWVDDINKM